jgi:hypothetical protein
MGERGAPWYSDDKDTVKKLFNKMGGGGIARECVREEGLEGAPFTRHAGSLN